ncbi:glycosyltransferase family 61 protein [Hymenobacter tibetensis]|uniref:Glycosyltransferase family 61 protein n=1 Tax=Hymenobacter tibetensis TaxID=497967 RepID=A0ABY4CZL7_9BACT|nr:glycosyltransferase family 61 protein [Hymenobacter tibetensis]UOG75711.1 glycosyltransferase family 61 protein [Hymenobacter tibetensis]
MKKSLFPSIAVTPPLPLNYAEAPEFFNNSYELPQAAHSDADVAHSARQESGRNDTRPYHTQEIGQWDVRGAFLFSNGLLYTPVNLLKESCVDAVFLHQYAPTYPLVRIAKDFLKRRIEVLPTAEKYVTIFDAWSSNHYHLLIDALPRLLLLEEHEAYILLAPDTSYMRKCLEPLLSLYGFRFKAVRYINRAVWVSQCRFISKLTTSGYTHPVLAKQLKERLALPYSHTRKLYVKRSNAAYRRVLNEVAVEALLVAHGFEVIDFDEYSIPEQARLAASAAIMVGMHGAGLTNAVFMPIGARLVEFRRTGVHHNHCYWFLAAGVGLEYATIFGKPDQSDLVLEGNGCNLTIPLDALELAIR